MGEGSDSVRTNPYPAVATSVKDQQKPPSVGMKQIWVAGPVEVGPSVQSLKFRSTDQVIRFLNESQPDLLVSAVTLPYESGSDIEDGIELLRYVHERFPEIETWLATEHDVQPDDVRLLGTGVSKVVRSVNDLE